MDSNIPGPIVFDEYKSLVVDANRLLILGEHANHLPLPGAQTARAGEVEEWILKEAGAKANNRHQELRVLRRILSVAVRKGFLFANPCACAEFPARVDGLFRPHYVSWSEQRNIELHAPDCPRNVIRTVTETGLRVQASICTRAM